MLSVLRMRSVVRGLSMLRPRQRPFNVVGALMSQAAASKESDVTDTTKAVIFDMGGVLIPSPLPFIAGQFSALRVCVIDSGFSHICTELL